VSEGVLAVEVGGEEARVVGVEGDAQAAALMFSLCGSWASGSRRSFQRASTRLEMGIW
jgi:hypothetical protein